MDGDITAAIIAASVAAGVGIINIILTVYKNRQDGITAYRMKWINDVREEFTKILGWSWYKQDSNGNLCFNDITELENSVNRVKLYLNINDGFDREILDLTTAYFNEIETDYIEFKTSSGGITEYTEEISKIECETKAMKSALLEKVRLYLKVEWTRVKYDSRIVKGKYRKYGCMRSFKSEKAIKELKKTE